MPFKQGELKTFLLQNKVDIIGCLETRVKTQKASNIQRKFGADWKFACNYDYASNGRIWLGWKTINSEVQILHVSAQCIHCKVQDKNSTFACLVSVVYGYNTINARKEFWSRLREIGMNVTEPWLVLGDFNTILSIEDRINGAPVHMYETVDFQQCIDDLGLGHITWRGNQFSWCNKREGEDRIYSHIDWVLGNDQWFQLYGSIESHYMNSGCSYHSPIIISTDSTNQRVKRPFRLLNVLLKKEEFKATVQRVWSQPIRGHTMYAIWRKLKLIEQATKDLHREYSTLEVKIQHIRDKLNHTQTKLNGDRFNDLWIQEEKNFLLQLKKWEDIHESVLRQQSRAIWIAQVDLNTKYFHVHLKARQSKNRVTSIYDEQGTLVSDPVLIQQQFTNFFYKLLGESALEIPCINVEIARDGYCLTLAEQQSMMLPVTTEEIEQTMKAMPSEKAPGLDGYTTEFFKEFWPVVGKDVTQVVMQFFENGKLLQALNNTSVTLVPKVTNPTYVKDFRPIACCNTVYKLISKIITNRLKPMVDKLVGKSQSA